MHGVVKQYVDLGGLRLSLDFIIFNFLATMCILLTSFLDRFVKAMRSKLYNIELDNGTIILTIQNPRT